MNLRKPTEQEKKELVDYLVKEGYIEAPEPDEDLFDGTIYAAVFDNYITDGPGYAGRVMVVVWSGAPEFTETYIWRRPILPEDEDKLMGEIDWLDGKHEQYIEKVVLDQAWDLVDDVVDKKIDAMIGTFQKEILKIYARESRSSNEFTMQIHMARLNLRSSIVELKVQSQHKNIQKAA